MTHPCQAVCFQSGIMGKGNAKHGRQCSKPLNLYWTLQIHGTRNVPNIVKALIRGFERQVTEADLSNPTPELAAAIAAVASGTSPGYSRGRKVCRLIIAFYSVFSDFVWSCGEGLWLSLAGPHVRVLDGRSANPVPWAGSCKLNIVSHVQH